MYAFSLHDLAYMQKRTSCLLIAHDVLTLPSRLWVALFTCGSSVFHMRDPIPGPFLCVCALIGSLWEAPTEPLP